MRGIFIFNLSFLHSRIAKTHNNLAQKFGEKNADFRYIR
jgi:hypothetical protein